MLLSYQRETDEKQTDLWDVDLAFLPIFSADSRDVLTQTVCVGKATMKAMYTAL